MVLWEVDHPILAPSSPRQVLAHPMDDGLEMPPTPRLGTIPLPDVGSPAFPPFILPGQQPPPAVLAQDASLTTGFGTQYVAPPIRADEPAVLPPSPILPPVADYPSPMSPLALDTPEVRIDALLTVPPSPLGQPAIVWDLAEDPRVARLRRENRALGSADLSRSAARTHSPLLPIPLPVTPLPLAHDEDELWQPLCSLYLVIPLLPDLEIEIRHAPASALGLNIAIVSRPGEPLQVELDPVTHVTIRDVLEGLARALHVPLDPGEHVQLALDPESAAEVQRARESGTRELRRVDLLGRWRRFLGIRPALRHEIPQGRQLGEVFAVELGAMPDAHEAAS